MIIAAALLVAAIVFTLRSKNEIAEVRYSKQGCFGSEKVCLGYMKRMG